MQLISPSDVFLHTITIAIILSTTAFMFWFKDSSDMKRGRHDVAVTLRIEIQRMLDIISPNGDSKGPRGVTKYNYIGLLNSGKISYLDNELQQDVDDLYSKISLHGTKPDKDLCHYILKKLKKIEKKSP